MDDQLRQLLERGRDAYDRSEYGDAEAFLESTLQLDRTRPNVYNMLGVIAHQDGRFGQAARSFEEALKLNPSYTEAALNLSVTYNDLGRYAEAKEVYAKAVAHSRGEPGAVGARALDPYVKGKLANMHADTGSAYEELRMYDEAVAEYRKALGLSPTFPDLRTRLGVALRDSGQREAAVSEFEEAKRLHPDYLPARIHLGVTLFSLGRKDEAAAEWRGVLEKDPKNKSCQAYLSILAAGLDHAAVPVAAATPPGDPAAKR